MRLLQASSSSIGSKILIALTGLGLAVFLIGHLAGNLLFLACPHAFNSYSHALVSNPLVYVAEAGLVAIFFLHVAKTVAGMVSNRAARPAPYAVRRWAKTKNPRSRKSLASSTMIYSAPNGVRDIYRLQVEVFSSPVYVGFYLLAMAVIFFHLWHGLSSAAQSLGVDHEQWTPRILVAGRVLAGMLGGGFFIIPIYTFLLSRGAL